MSELVVADRSFYMTTWTCEKWSEEAVAFARKKLVEWGVEEVPVASAILPAGHLPKSMVDQKLSALLGRPVADLTHIPLPERYAPVSEGVPSAFLHMIVGEAEVIEVVEGNMLVNEGIQRLIDLTQIATVLTNQTAANAWGNTNAFLGVGDSSTAEAATQTELQAATNKTYKGMNATYPSRTNQTVSYQSDFLTGEANYVWNEWTISAGATGGPPATAGTTNLNRKVAALGTKASGTWTLTSQVTYS